MTLSLWRISNHADLSGEGGRRSAGRWNTLGTPIVYAADHPASAMLEMLVHVDVGDLPETFQLIEIVADDPLVSDVGALAPDWRMNRSATQAAYARFVSAGATPMLRVPSAIVPHAWNFLINPLHPNIASIRLGLIEQHPFDQRIGV